MALEESGNDLASQQRLLQSYMDNLFSAQPTNNPSDGSNFNASRFNPGGQAHPQFAMAPPPQAMHPGISSTYQQNQQRYQPPSNGQGNSHQHQQASFQQQQQQQQPVMWPVQSNQILQQQSSSQPRQTFPQAYQPPQPVQQQQLSQAEIQAMFASLGANQPSQSAQLSLLPPLQHQQGQPQGQPFQPNPAYNSQLQAAFQQLQQSHSATPPLPHPGFQVQQQQQQQGGPIGSNDANMLLKLRQSGMQLTPEQQAYFSRAMLRRGALADGQPGSNPPPVQQGQSQGSMVTQQLLQQPSLQIPTGFRQSNQLPTSSLPLGLSNLQLAQPQQQQQQHLQQHQQQHASLFQPQPQQVPSQAGPIPVNILQEFTGLSEQLRNLTSQEQHLSVCLAKNLNIPLQKPAPGQQAPPPQPLNQGQRSAVEKQLESTRRMLHIARETLARLAADHGGKDNILAHLKTFAQQRQAAQQQLHAQAQAHAQTQMQSHAQQQFQQQQQAGTGVIINRAQIRTPVNGLPIQAQGQGQGQSQNQGAPLPLANRPSNLPTGQGQGQTGPSPAQLHTQTQVATPQQAHAQAQLQRAMAMQHQLQQQQQGQQKQQQQQQQPQPGPMQQTQAQINMSQSIPSPNPASRALPAPPVAGISSPSVGILSGPSSQGQGQQQQQPLSMPLHGQGQQNQAHQQFLKNQAAAVNEEILKTLNVAGPNAFRKALFDTMRKRGTPISTTPRVDGKEVDLVKLYTVVQQRGGCHPIRQQGLWRQVALEIDVPVDAESALRISQSLSQVYTDYLEPFEEIQRKAALANYQKSQVHAQTVANTRQQQQQHQQQLLQQGGSRQPSPGPAPLQQMTPQQNQAVIQHQQQQQLTQNQQQYLHSMQHLQQQAQQQYAANLQQQQAQANLQQQYLQTQNQSHNQNPNQSQNQNQNQNQGLSQTQGTPNPSSSTFPTQHQQKEPLAQPLPQQQHVPLSHQRVPSQPQNQQQPLRTQGTPTVQPASLQQQHAQMAQVQLQPVPQPNGQQQATVQRPPGLPSQEEINRAKNEVAQMRATLMNAQPQYERLPPIEPVDQETFTAAARSLAPMVDKIIERLPLYLALSHQAEGTRRLLIMMFMFKEQLSLLDRKEYILRLHDLDKLRIQMQRCWSFITISAAATNASPPSVPGTVEPSLNVSNVPILPAVQNATVLQTGQTNNNPGIGIDIEVADIPAAAFKAGLRVEDLKPPLPKHRRIESSGNTPLAIVASPITVPAGTGATYASPIALDSPSPEKSAVDNKAETKPIPLVVPAASKHASKMDTKASATIAPTKPAAKNRGKAKIKQAAPPITDISVPELATTTTHSAAGVRPADEVTQHFLEQQQVSLKRKRELEDAQTDPAGFTERILASYLSIARPEEAPTTATADAAASSSSSSSSSGSNHFSAELLSFLNVDLFQDSAMAFHPSTDEGLESNSTSRKNNNDSTINFFLDDDSSPTVQGMRWFSETASLAAETPELATSDDPMKTSPPDHDSVGTPSDAHHHPFTLLQQQQQKNLGNLSSPSSAILSSFDQEYHQIFDSLSSTNATTQAAKADVNTMNWSWDVGPTLVT